MSDLKGPGTIAAQDIAVGYVSNRITRVSGDGAVYTISPRYVMPSATVNVAKGVTRRFWLTIRPPQDAKAGVYRGEITITPEHGQVARARGISRLSRHARRRRCSRRPVELYHRHPLGWRRPRDQRVERHHGRARAAQARDYGFTTFSGLPIVQYQGFKNGKPQLDFREGDRQMELARRCGFTMPVITYTHFGGLNLYYKDDAAMKAAGFSDYSQFVKAIFSAIQEHADAANWLPVYWNLGDEPIGDDLRRAAENAEAYKAAFPKGPPFFTAATSFDSGKPDDPHFRFGKALHAANVNGHNEASIRMLHDAGANWAFYNGGNRWTYGIYMYKAAKQFDMKFRVNWHWNAAAGDPYYALDCREDDYSWCNATPDGQLLPSVYFEREMREGLNDYRYMLTLARLAKEKNDAAGQALVNDRLAAFKLGQREHDALFPASDWREFRQKMAEAIARLR